MSTKTEVPANVRARLEHYGGVGFHVYAAPDTETIKARMLARREDSDAR